MRNSISKNFLMNSNGANFLLTSQSRSLNKSRRPSTIQQKQEENFKFWYKGWRKSKKKKSVNHKGRTHMIMTGMKKTSPFMDSLFNPSLPQRCKKGLKRSQ